MSHGKKMRTPKISIITATFNAAKTLPSLINDLQSQSCNDFEWIVSDGGSQDSTLSLLSSELGIDVRISSQSDFGIYDALNRGVLQSHADYYLVIGADDRLDHQAVENYLKAIAASKADIITADIMIDGRRHRASPNWQVVKGIDAFISSHSVGAVFRKALHDRVGLYSRKLPICADQLFVYKAHRAGARTHKADFVAGEFTLDGTSGRDALGIITETCRAKILAGYSVPLQLLILALRILKNHSLIRHQSQLR